MNLCHNPGGTLSNPIRILYSILYLKYVFYIILITNVKKKQNELKIGRVEAYHYAKKTILKLKKKGDLNWKPINCNLKMYRSF